MATADPIAAAPSAASWPTVADADSDAAPALALDDRAPSAVSADQAAADAPAEPQREDAPGRDAPDGPQPEAPPVPPSNPQPPETPERPSTPQPAPAAPPEHPFMPGDPAPSPSRPSPAEPSQPSQPDAPFIPMDPRPVSPGDPPPPGGPQLACIPANAFAGRIVDGPPMSDARQLDMLLARIDRLIARPSDAAVQREVAALIAMLPRLEQPQNVPMLAIAERLVSALSQEPPQVELATQLRVALHASTRGWSNLARRVRAATPSIRMLCGLALFLFVMLPVLVLVASLVAGRALDKGFEPMKIVMVAGVGAVGSIISIMVRVQDFDENAVGDPLAQLFMGAFRPLIGSAFALFAYTVIKAGILPIGVPLEREPYFFAALAFLSGFSERFASDLVDRTEQSLSASIRGGTGETKMSANVTVESGTSAGDGKGGIGG
ncbi:MAG: hypothetical protein JWM27_1581 [Gemmatimonadetes bacterium]|nr:hypothetical protein [Gemmatimonadota bacterium]